MNWHEVIDERNWEMDRVVAGILESDPARLNRVTEWIDKRLADSGFSTASKKALREWRELIDLQGLEGVLNILMIQDAANA